MGASDKTPNKNLPIWQNGDKFSILGDLNDAMTKVDTSLHTQETQNTTTANLASSAMVRADAAQADVDTLGGTVAAQATTITGVQQSVADETAARVASDEAMTTALNKAMADLQMGNPGKKYKMVSGQIRNMGGAAWELITGAHSNIGVDAIGYNQDFITIDYSSIGATKVVSFITTVDERLALEGFSVGASAGVSSASIMLAKLGGYADFIEWTGTRWSSKNSVFDFDTSKFATDGFLYCTHPAFPVSSATDVFDMSVSGRSNVIAAAEGGSSDRLTVRFMDSNFTTLKAPNTSCRAFVSHRMSGRADPRLVTNSLYPNSNLWFFGIFEV